MFEQTVGMSFSGWDHLQRNAIPTTNLLNLYITRPMIEVSLGMYNKIDLVADEARFADANLMAGVAGFPLSLDRGSLSTVLETGPPQLLPDTNIDLGWKTISTRIIEASQRAPGRPHTIVFLCFKNIFVLFRFASELYAQTMLC